MRKQRKHTREEKVEAFVFVERLVNDGLFAIVVALALVYWGTGIDLFLHLAWGFVALQLANCFIFSPWRGRIFDGMLDREYGKGDS